MTFEEAARVLGVKLAGLDENEVRVAFNRAIRLSHPDAGGGTASAGENIARAKKARDKLLSYCAPAEEKPACKQCNGTGTVRGALFNRVCPNCSGRGQ